MRFLVVASVVCALAASLDACFSIARKPGITGCRDDNDNTWHAVGTRWRTSNCMDCTCHGCCRSYSTPTRFPDDCVSEFDAIACEYKVHKKNDPTVACPVFAGVA